MTVGIEEGKMVRAIAGTWGSGLRKAPCTCDEKRLVTRRILRKSASPNNQMLGLGNKESVKTNWKIKSDEHHGT